MDKCLLRLNLRQWSLGSLAPDLGEYDILLLHQMVDSVQSDNANRN
jgi:hypothetical protein